MANFTLKDLDCVEVVDIYTVNYKNEHFKIQFFNLQNPKDIQFKICETKYINNELLNNAIHKFIKNFVFSNSTTLRDFFSK
jgi:hypothetical protein